MFCQLKALRSENSDLLFQVKCFVKENPNKGKRKKMALVYSPKLDLLLITKTCALDYSFKLDQLCYSTFLYWIKMCRSKTVLLNAFDKISKSILITLIRYNFSQFVNKHVRFEIYIFFLFVKICWIYAKIAYERK